jgi:hypothetical protein
MLIPMEVVVDPLTEGEQQRLGRDVRAVAGRHLAAHPLVLGGAQPPDLPARRAHS